jgi:uncharacterized protein YwqG
MRSIEEMRAAFSRAGLSHHADALLHIARFATRIQAIPCDMQQVPTGASRFGGDPDLPPDFEWPSYEGKAHEFLAQIDLSSLPRPLSNELPESGWLVFFYEVESMKWGFDPIDRGCALVRFIPPTVQLRRRSRPVRNEENPARACALSFTPMIDAVDWCDELCDALKLSKAEKDAYFAFLEEDQTTEMYHHLLGHPQIVQNGMRQECQLAANGIYCGGGTLDASESEQGARLVEGWPDWELLLQLDSDEDGPGWMWGDSGRIYFWIRRDDLRARRFEDVWLVLQCG